MAEQPRDDAVNSLGSIWPPGINYPAKGASGSTAHAEAMAAALLRIGDALVESTGMEVYKDAANPSLTIGVRAGAFFDGTTLVTYAGTTGFALTDDADNYVYLTRAGVLTKSTVSFPNTAHIPLAEVAAGSQSASTTSGTFAVLDITDRRGRAMFGLVEPTAGDRPFEMLEDFNLGSGETLPLPWASDTHGSATADYMDDEPGGVYQLALDNTSEIQASQLTWNDHQTIDSDNDPIFEARVRVDGIAALTSVEQIAIGLCKVHAAAEDALDNIDHSVWFLLKGAADLNIYMEADDGATDTDDTDTGINLVDDTWTVFRIDMSDLTAVKMSVDGVEAGATLDMTQSAGQLLQPVFVAQRTADTEAEVGFEVEVDLAYVRADRA